MNSFPGMTSRLALVCIEFAGQSTVHAGTASDVLASNNHDSHCRLKAQAVATLLVWMRVLQILFVFPSTGPLLLMTLRMLDDLWKFLMLASIIIVAFACSFYVLLTAEAEPEVVSLQQMLGLLAEGAMNAEPEATLE